MDVEHHLDRFGTADGQLCVGGVPLRRLTARVGSTPYFAYDRDAITARAQRLRAALGPQVELGYAVKANPMPAVVGHLAGLIDWLDVASAGEMHVALDAAGSPARTSFAGPGKTDAELEQAVAAGVLVELESAGEADRITGVGERLGMRPRVAVRVNPDFVVKGSGMRMGGGPQQFGVDVEQVPALLDRLVERDLAVEGFHLFAGSQNLHAEIIVEAQQRTVELLLALADKAPGPLSYLNLGGGFGIPYFDKDQPLDLVRVGEQLRALVAERLHPALPDAHVVVELGRFLVGEAGVYVTRVVDRKVSRGTTYLVVDGGMHHQLAASGNFGQVIRRNYPLVVGDRLDAERDERADVVGCLCTPLDVLGTGISVPDARVGDLVVLFQAGAYGRSASPLGFLGHPAPPEILV
ncbi:pyridoxal-dependent decarboxylase, exosortase A system-associated [Nocardioides sp. dk4132]|uniref:pyridoxal-dependent decarboxylase, exosortase A system-associated n=1 Tax=unclassified Nocardioides TaxID=2615069 RepID=UPI001296AC34|nr:MULTISPECIES: pyridoxal-dependent decarboxylase, exosortase A system-associated [unclassified Nocardioides]MQW74793.1 pyridoxal-dependent decarboxylase, exosortase A system-associated [Nocardioides sp. dk4132]QGA06685.1 pyridoxal-dependent decarboxylase, exosortase A system-associated [Nocardioides sp. dk884]